MIDITWAFCLPTTSDKGYTLLMHCSVSVNCDLAPQPKQYVMLVKNLIYLFVYKARTESGILLKNLFINKIYKSDQSN